jgi:hypothetical protein
MNLYFFRRYWGLNFWSHIYYFSALLCWVFKIGSRFLLGLASNHDPPDLCLPSG